MIAIRAATAADQKTITALIRAAGIITLGLHWPRFALAVDEATGQVVGTGQIKPHGDGTFELASIATVPAYQRRGIARQVIEHLMARFAAERGGPLYLITSSNLGSFYEQFGFREVPPDEMPPYFRRLHKLAKVLVFATSDSRRMLVMKRDFA
jgi:N-acetylglutamate synthase-like GNAT family acetyltransferase